MVDEAVDLVVARHRAQVLLLERLGAHDEELEVGARHPLEGIGLAERLAKELGLPRVVIYGDLNDLRLYSDEQTRTQIEALVEQLEQARA